MMKVVKGSLKKQTAFHLKNRKFTKKISNDKQ